jgi:hypothetical protein
MRHLNWQKLSIQSVFKVYSKWADLIAYLLQMDIDKKNSKVIDGYEVIYPLTMNDPFCEEFLRSENFLKGSWIKWIVIKKDVISLSAYNEEYNIVYEANLSTETLYWVV